MGGEGDVGGVGGKGEASSTESSSPSTVGKIGGVGIEWSLSASTLSIEPYMTALSLHICKSEGRSLDHGLRSLEDTA